VPWPAVVRQVNRLQGDALVLEDAGELAQGLGVGAVTAPREDGSLIQPDEVAAIRPGSAGQPRSHRDTRRLQRRAQMRRFRRADRLGHLEENHAGSGHQSRVPDIGGVYQAVDRGRDLDGAAEIGEQPGERLMLAHQQLRTGYSPARGAEVTRNRRPAQQHTAQRRRHGPHPEAWPCRRRAAVHRTRPWLLPRHHAARAGRGAAGRPGPCRGRARCAAAPGRGSGTRRAGIYRVAALRRRHSPSSHRCSPATWRPPPSVHPNRAIALRLSHPGACRRCGRPQTWEPAVAMTSEVRSAAST
jgi:hypothetical protein